ncbi:MAG: DNA/RNA nuclease SfsA [Desulfuromonadales bacterium]|nr:DNA/RNA nuclease SfsA [Desulfuromonadales bacterium]
MRLPEPLIAGRLVRRYRRFLADVELTDGSVVTAHTPNTGSMLQCAVPGHAVLLSRSDDPKRKLAWSWELVQVNGHWVDINTQRANRVVEEALCGNVITEFQDYSVRREYPFADSRIDFMLTKGDEKVLLEVKNVTLCCTPRQACFPDAVTERGQKHLRDLMTAIDNGWRAALLFLVQRGEAESFAPADHIDPTYGELLREAGRAGVEILACQTAVTPTESRIVNRLPVRLADRRSQES